MMKKTVLAVVTVSMLGLAGCSAVHTAVAKRNLDVQTKMSETIFLEPAAERTVYLQIRNTSTEQDLSLEPKLRQALQNKGMSISTNPDTALGRAPSMPATTIRTPQERIRPASPNRRCKPATPANLRWTVCRHARS